LLCMTESLLQGAAKDRAKRPQRVIPLPSDLVHPSMLESVDEDDHQSLLQHGYTFAEFGGRLASYARPACEVAPWFSCWDIAETSHDALQKYLPEAIRLLQKAARLQPNDSTAYRLLLTAQLSASNITAALDTFEQHWMRPELQISADDRVLILNSVHVHATRNCR
jgi:hypothetical protein